MQDKEYYREYYRKNRDRIRAYRRAWDKKNRKKLNEAQKQWKLKNPERAREINRLAQIRFRMKKKAEQNNG